MSEVEAWTGPSPAPRYNLALNATATTSSNFTGWPASSLTNGDRKSLNAGTSGGWVDAAPANTFPDWAQVDFGTNKTINEIDVFTLQDNYAGSSEPTESMTFTQWGLTGFEVQYWDGSAWITVPNGSVTGNNKIWRKFTFSPISTSKIRVLTNASVDGYSRLTEIEAYGPADSGGSGGLHWLISDHLGTPRMIFDQTGDLANVSRHDYLPFGEELFTAGGRSPEQGYTAGDAVRQQFTSKERDVETGMDYFLARYYSSNEGRFVSTDPFSPVITKQIEHDADAAQRAFTEWIGEPQRWNSYHYALNNPLRVLDPDGRNPQEALEALKQGLQRLVSFSNLAKSLIANGKANIMATATEMALNNLFGNIRFSGGGLNASEIELAKEVSAFEERSFQGAGQHAAGIDGFLHDGKLPTNNPRPVQLQENSMGGDYRLLTDAGRHEQKANNAGYKNIVLYIKATDPNVTVNSVVKFVEGGGASGFVGMTHRGTFTNVTIFTRDGVVKIENGSVTSVQK